MSEPAAQLSSHLASLRYKLQHHGEWASNTTLVQLVAEEVLVVRRAVSKQRDDLFNAICASEPYHPNDVWRGGSNCQ
jgi:hypothetical protein